MNRYAVIGLAICTVVVSLLPVAHAKKQSSAGSTPSRREAQAAQAAASTQSSASNLDNFAWLAGRWQGDWGPRTAEQVWMAPKAGLMLGTFRLIEDDKTLVIELFTLLQKPDSIEFRFRHFTPELVNWEKSDATILTLERADPKKMVFVNAVNGQPKHAILTRVDDDTYVSRSEIVPDSGDMQVVEITYHRQKQAPGPSNQKPHPAKH